MKTEDRFSIIVIYARSGGTLLSRFLSQLPNVIFLSEVNPMGTEAGRIDSAPKTPSEQADKWYNLPGIAEDFEKSILQLHDHCTKNELRLIIRDWSFINFETLGHSAPSYRLETFKSLAKYNPNGFVFIRDTIDVWISRGMPELDGFLTAYEAYVDSLLQTGFPIVRYEDFCQMPEATMNRITELLELPKAEVADIELQAATRISGDVQFTSRGNWRNKIATLKRKRIPADMIKLLKDNSERLANIGKHFGYNDDYYSVPVESRIEQFSQKIKRRISPRKGS